MLGRTNTNLYSGVSLNAKIENYKVANGESIVAGDFVKINPYFADDNFIFEGKAGIICDRVDENNIVIVTSDSGTYNLIVYDLNTKEIKSTKSYSLVSNNSYCKIQTIRKVRDKVFILNETLESSDENVIVTCRMITFKVNDDYTTSILDTESVGNVYTPDISITSSQFIKFKKIMIDELTEIDEGLFVGVWVQYYRIYDSSTSYHGYYATTLVKIQVSENGTITLTHITPSSSTYFKDKQSSYAHTLYGIDYRTFVSFSSSGTKTQKAVFWDLIGDKASILKEIDLSGSYSDSGYTSFGSCRKDNLILYYINVYSSEQSKGTYTMYLIDTSWASQAIVSIKRIGAKDLGTTLGSVCCLENGDFLSLSRSNVLIFKYENGDFIFGSVRSLREGRYFGHFIRKEGSKRFEESIIEYEIPSASIAKYYYTNLEIEGFNIGIKENYSSVSVSNSYTVNGVAKDSGSEGQLIEVYVPN